MEVKEKIETENSDIIEYSTFLKEANRLVEENGKNNYYVVYSDIAEFQRINKIFGYSTGDKLLSDLCVYLKTELKSILCGKIYSDHFVFLLSKEDGEKYFNKDEASAFNKNLDAFVFAQDEKLRKCGIYVICGISVVSSSNVIESVDTANMARKHAKKTGKNCIVAFEKSIDNENFLTKSIRELINNSLSENRFVVYYQPIVDAKTGKIEFFESLSRGFSDDGNIVYPGDYINIMEDNGSIIEFDFFVIEEVCKILKENLLNFNDVVPVCINLSRMHIRNHISILTIENLVKKYGIPSNLLIFELTENVFIDDYGEARLFIQKLHEFGFKVSMDDFGSRYSGVNDLVNLPFDYIKLDKSFITGKNALNDRTKSILKWLVRSAKAINMQVICEGVETQEQCEFLSDIKCEFYQGYFFSKPLSCDDAKKFLYNKKNAFSVFKSKNKKSKKVLYELSNEEKELRTETKENLGIGFWNYCIRTNLLFLPDIENIANIRINNATYIDADRFVNLNIIHPSSIDSLKKLLFSESKQKTECIAYFYTNKRRYEKFRISGMWAEDDNGRKFIGSYEKLPEELSKKKAEKEKSKLKKASLKKDSSIKLDVSFGATISALVVALVFLIYMNYHDLNKLLQEEVSTPRITNYNLITGLVLCIYLIIGFIALLRIFQKQTSNVTSEKMRYTILSEFTDTTLCEYDIVKDTLTFTPNALKLIGLESTSFSDFGKNIEKFCFNSEDRAKIEGILMNINQNGTGEFELRLFRPNGEKFWSLCQYRSIVQNGNVVEIICKIIDIDNRKKKEEQLLNKSIIDFTTSLQNKESIQMTINSELEKDGTTGFIYMMDVDNFKTINDTYGHAKGDEVLAKISEIIVSVFGSNKFAGRVGGDEFIAFLNNEIKYDVAEEKAEKILSLLKEYSDESQIVISVSIGIVSYPNCASDFYKLYELADKAMYKSKALGKNRYYFYN